MYSELRDGKIVYSRNREQIHHPPERRSASQLWLDVRGWNRLPPHPKSAFIVHGQKIGVCGESPIVETVSPIWIGPVIGSRLRCNAHHGLEYF